MKWANKANKILENKYVLYFSVFLAITTIFGFLMLKKWNAIMFFILIALIMSFLTQNMSIVLLVSVFGANLALSKGTIMEGMETGTTPIDTSNIPDNTLTEMKDNVSSAISDAKENKLKTDITTAISSTSTPSTTATEAMIDGANPKQLTSSHKNNKTKNNGGSRLDYAATLEEAYDNLDKILDGDSLGKLTTDTQKLMEQQKKLYKTMESMTPMIKDAKDMLKGFDMGSIKSLANMFPSSS